MNIDNKKTQLLLIQTFFFILLKLLKFQ